jgi:hypothetical protein
MNWLWFKRIRKKLRAARYEWRDLNQEESLLKDKCHNCLQNLLSPLLEERGRGEVMGSCERRGMSCETYSSFLTFSLATRIS